MVEVGVESDLVGEVAASGGEEGTSIGIQRSDVETGATRCRHPLFPERHPAAVERFVGYRDVVEDVAPLPRRGDGEGIAHGSVLVETALDLDGVLVVEDVEDQRPVVDRVVSDGGPGLVGRRAGDGEGVPDPPPVPIQPDPLDVPVAAGVVGPDEEVGIADPRQEGLLGVHTQDDLIAHRAVAVDPAGLEAEAVPIPDDEEILPVAGDDGAELAGQVVVADGELGDDDGPVLIGDGPVDGLPVGGLDHAGEFHLIVGAALLVDFAPEGMGLVGGEVEVAHPVVVLGAEGIVLPDLQPVGAAEVGSGVGGEVVGFPIVQADAVVLSIRPYLRSGAVLVQHQVVLAVIARIVLVDALDAGEADVGAVVEVGVDPGGEAAAGVVAGDARAFLCRTIAVGPVHAPLPAHPVGVGEGGLGVAEVDGAVGVAAVHRVLPLQGGDEVVVVRAGGLSEPGGIEAGSHVLRGLLPGWVPRPFDAQVAVVQAGEHVVADGGRLAAGPCVHGEGLGEDLPLVAEDVEGGGDDAAAQEGGRGDGEGAQRVEVGGEVVLDGGGVGQRLSGEDEPVLVVCLGVEGEGAFVEDVGVEGVVVGRQLVERPLGQIAHPVAVGVEEEGVGGDEGGEAGDGEGPPAQPLRRVAVVVAVAEVLVVDLLVVVQAVAVGVAAAGVGAELDLLGVAEAVHIAVGAQGGDVGPSVLRADGADLKFVGVGETVAVGVRGCVVRIVAVFKVGVEEAVAIPVLLVEEGAPLPGPGEVKELVQRPWEDVEDDGVSYGDGDGAGDRFVRTDGEDDDVPTIQAGDGEPGVEVERDGDVDARGKGNDRRGSIYQFTSVQVALNRETQRPAEDRGAVGLDFPVVLSLIGLRNDGIGNRTQFVEEGGHTDRILGERLRAARRAEALRVGVDSGRGDLETDVHVSLCHHPFLGIYQRHREVAGLHRDIHEGLEGVEQ